MLAAEEKFGRMQQRITLVEIAIEHRQIRWNGREENIVKFVLPFAYLIESVQILQIALDGRVQFAGFADRYILLYLLPTVMAYNAPATGDKYRAIAEAMGVEGTGSMTIEKARKAAVEAVRKLAQDVGIPADLKGILKEEDVQFLSESAYADACRPGNPRDTSVEEIAALFRSLL